MKLLLFLLVGGGVLVMLMRNRRPKPAPASPAQEPEPRNFLKQASSQLDTPKPLSEMLEEDRAYTMQALVETLQTGGTYERKYAAFALGQIGDPATEAVLDSCVGSEQVQGVREAIGAALAAVRMAPADKGHTEMERRKIIQRAY